VSAQQSSSQVAPIPSPLRPTGPFGRFADDLLVIELPDLPDDRRTETVAFVCRRAGQVPTPLRLGIVALAVGTGAAQRLVGAERTAALLRATSLPFVGELSRLVRSLGFAYVWETWPSTTPSGAAA
jgi:hypothetical protein